MTRLEAYTKVNNRLSDLIVNMKDLVLFPFTKVKSGTDWEFGSEYGKSSEGSWLRALKAKNFKENRVPGDRGFTNLGARADLNSQKSSARKYLFIGLLVTAAITAASVLLKRHLENIKYEKKRLEELNKKFELNTATEAEVKEAVELSEKILQICAMEDPRKTEIAIDELENEIVKEVA